MKGNIFRDHSLILKMVAGSNHSVDERKATHVSIQRTSLHKLDLLILGLAQKKAQVKFTGPSVGFYCYGF